MLQLPLWLKGTSPGLEKNMLLKWEKWWARAWDGLTAYYSLQGKGFSGLAVRRDLLIFLIVVLHWEKKGLFNWYILPDICSNWFCNTLDLDPWLEVCVWLQCGQHALHVPEARSECKVCSRGVSHSPGWEGWGCSAWRRESSREELRAAFQDIKRPCRKAAQGLFTRTCSGRTRENDL